MKGNVCFGGRDAPSRIAVTGSRTLVDTRARRRSCDARPCLRSSDERQTRVCDRCHNVRDREPVCPSDRGARPPHWCQQRHHQALRATRPDREGAQDKRRLSTLPCPGRRQNKAHSGSRARRLLPAAAFDVPGRAPGWGRPLPRCARRGFTDSPGNRQTTCRTDGGACLSSEDARGLGQSPRANTATPACTPAGHSQRRDRRSQTLTRLESQTPSVASIRLTLEPVPGPRIGA